MQIFSFSRASKLVLNKVHVVLKHASDIFSSYSPYRTVLYFMSNEPVESGSVFTAKDEMLMRGTGMQDAPLFSTQWNNEELLKKKCHNLYLCWFYGNSCERELKDRWFILGCSFRAFFNFFLRNYLFKISVSFKYFIQWRIRNFFQWDSLLNRRNLWITRC